MHFNESIRNVHVARKHFAWLRNACHVTLSELNADTNRYGIERDTMSFRNSTKLPTPIVYAIASVITAKIVYSQ